VVRVLLLLLLLLLPVGALANQPAGGAPTTAVTPHEAIDIIQTLADPAQYVQYFPDTDRWLPWFGQRVREFRVPQTLYYMGLFLLLAGVAFLVYQLMLGLRPAVDVLVRALVVVVLWQMMVLTPSQVQDDCSETTRNQFPCQIQLSDPQLQNLPVLEETQINGERGFHVVNRQIYVRHPVAHELPSHYLVKRLFRDVMLANGNAAIMASLQREAVGIQRTRDTVMTLSMVSWTAAGATSVVDSVPAKVRCLAGGAGGAVTADTLAGLSGQAVQGCLMAAGGASEIARNVGAVLNTVRSALILGPMLVIATFHTINTIAGIYLYSLLFLMPLLIPLVLIAGTGVMATAAKFGLVAMITPLISGVLLSTGLSLSYSYSSQRVNELNAQAERLRQLRIPPQAAVFAPINNTVAARQLHNLRQCMQASANNVVAEGLICNGNTDDFLRRELPPYFGNPIRIPADRDYRHAAVLRAAIEQTVPRFANAPGGNWEHLQPAQKAAIYQDLTRLLGSDTTSSTMGNTEGMLRFFQQHQAYPDFLPRGDIGVFAFGLQGMDRRRTRELLHGMRTIAFNAGSLPQNSLLTAQDTWANGNKSLSLMNNMVAANASVRDFQGLLTGALRNKMLNLILLTIVAVGITVAILGVVTQMLGAFFGALVSVGASGLAAVQRAGGGFSDAGRWSSDRDGRGSGNNNSGGGSGSAGSGGSGSNPRQNTPTGRTP
jgi:hypothetical protein